MKRQEVYHNNKIQCIFSDNVFAQTSISAFLFTYLRFHRIKLLNFYCLSVSLDSTFLTSLLTLVATMDLEILKTKSF